MEVISIFPNCLSIIFTVQPLDPTSGGEIVNLHSPRVQMIFIGAAIGLSGFVVLMAVPKN